MSRKTGRTERRPQMKFPILAAAAALLALAQTAAAHEFKIADLIVDHPMTYETTPMARTGGGYLSITNTGTGTDRLIGVKADFPRVELHLSETKDGVATMRRVEGVDIPAGETVALKPGSYHVMFMGLDGDPFEVGEEIPAVLVFENAGELPVVFNVEKRGASAPKAMDHSKHGSGG